MAGGGTRELGRSQIWGVLPGHWKALIRDPEDKRKTVCVCVRAIVFLLKQWRDMIRFEFEDFLGCIVKTEVKGHWETSFAGCRREDSGVSDKGVGGG